MKLRPGTWIALDGPTSGPEDMLAGWTTGTPFDQAPVRLDSAEGEPLAASVSRLREKGMSVVSVAHALAEERADPLDALHRVYGEERPDVLVVWPGPDGQHPRALRALARETEDVVLLPAESAALLRLYAFDALARRDLYSWN